MDNVNILYQQWCKEVSDPVLAEDLRSIAGDPHEINERFYRSLSFGTAGLRGILGAGSNRMNIYTVGATTQGLAEYLNAQGAGSSVAIAYDSRNNSTLFAEITATVLAANGIHVHLYRELMPTPALSFAVRYLKCAAGVVITASHNPAKYNGYKAYGMDGSQLSPEAADQVLGYIEKINCFSGVKNMPLSEALEKGLVEYISQQTEEAYFSAVLAQQIDTEICKKSPISVVYTPLNGAGMRSVKTIMERIGVENVTVVPEQEKPDGNFPTCSYPNPEEAGAMDLGLRLAEQVGSDILIATDPDADRAGVAVPNGKVFQRLTGNEIGVLMLRYIVERRRSLGTLPENPIAVKSLVSTKLADRLATEMGVTMVDVLTGFKFIGEQISLLEEKGEGDRFIMGFEESSGYLTGGHVRDKDAVNAVMILCEMTAYYKSQGKTLLTVLDEVYAICGRYLSVVDSYTFEGADGSEKMKTMLSTLRSSAPSAIGGYPVASIGDYLSGERVTLEGGEKAAINLPHSDILEYSLNNGVSVIVRPSGTEPKIKVYYSVVAKDLPGAQALYGEISAGVKALLGV